MLRVILLFIYPRTYVVKGKSKSLFRLSNLAGNQKRRELYTVSLDAVKTCFLVDEKKTIQFEIRS